MGFRNIAVGLFLFLIANSNTFASEFNSNFKLGGIELKPAATGNAIEFTVGATGRIDLSGTLGLSIAEAAGQPSTDCDPGNADICFMYGDYAKLLITANSASNGHCATVEWTSTYARRLEDCYDLVDGIHWYGGGGPKYIDTWPIDKTSRAEAPIVPGDSMGGSVYGGVSENYWLVSTGVAIHVDEDIALWFSMNSTNKNKACFVAKDTYPYNTRAELNLKYDLCVGTPTETFKDVHLRNIVKYYDRPTSLPDERMLIDPIWSTWAQYHRNVNQTLVMQLAERLVEEGFSKNSHIEVDDMWESWYGEAEFNAQKFPDPKGMVESLHELGFRVTAWTVPFINIECPCFQEPFDKGYFVKDQKDRFGMTDWWQGTNSGMIDFTNEEAVEWWSSRLEALRVKYGLDGFKFDAGEFNWLPYGYKLRNSQVSRDPSYATTKYVEAVAKFGGLGEVRVGRLNQKEAIFTRMLDKDSRFGYDNGLRSVIPTLLDFGLKGYTFVLPDMIGGNAYGTNPVRELYIRWIQANVFMPSIQFSILPWEYDLEVVSIVKEILNIRNEFASKIIDAAKQSIVDGSPINRPMWWADPSDPNTHAIDDQYMLGDDILVAPVLTLLERKRDIYLPKGTWTIRVGEDTETYEGPILLQGYPAELHFLPWFIRT